jgi:4-hydroxy-tetrahydrodipicolinate reductase
MNVLLLGRHGKVGSVLGPALEAAGHVLVETTEAAEAAVDFTRPNAVEENVRVCLEAGLPCVVGTTGFDRERVAALADVHDLPVFFAPNFAL